MFVSIPSTGKVAERRHQAGHRRVTRFGRGDDLGQQRVVVHGDPVAFGHTAVHTHAGQPRLTVEQQRPRLRNESTRGRLGVDAGLDRMAALSERLLRPRQRLA